MTGRLDWINPLILTIIVSSNMEDKGLFMYLTLSGQGRSEVRRFPKFSTETGILILLLVSSLLHPNIQASQSTHPFSSSVFLDSAETFPEHLNR